MTITGLDVLMGFLAFLALRGAWGVTMDLVDFATWVRDARHALRAKRDREGS